MGWAGYDLLDKKFKLFSRGGTKDVFITNADDSVRIEIPSELLKELVAEEIRMKRIEELEQMSDDEILGL